MRSRRANTSAATWIASIAVIARAQRADGYLHTPVLIAWRNGDTNAAPFKDRHNFEMYNLGHLLHRRVRASPGHRPNEPARRGDQGGGFPLPHVLPMPRPKRRAVPSARRTTWASLISTARPATPRYLELAKKFFSLRGEITDGGDDNQDRVPFAQQTNAVGHAVRANYLYAGAADLFLETGDTNLWRPLEPIWRNLTGQKMYITGGCGALFDGASPYGAKDQKTITRTHQAYGRNYELPNTTAHNETCANIGNVLWNWRMFLATGEARFMDVAELALYNSVLSGMSLDGTNFFYVNPLRTTDPLPTELRWKHQRVPYLSSFCCPPNLARTIAGSAQYAYAKSADTIWVNLYGASRLDTEMPGGGRIKLRQETEYPWSGRVRIVIDEAGAGRVCPEAPHPRLGQARFRARQSAPGGHLAATRRLPRNPAVVEGRRHRGPGIADAGRIDRGQSARRGDARASGRETRADRLLPRIARPADRNAGR